MSPRVPRSVRSEMRGDGGRRIGCPIVDGHAMSRRGGSLRRSRLTVKSGCSSAKKSAGRIDRSTLTGRPSRASFSDPSPLEDDGCRGRMSAARSCQLTSAPASPYNVLAMLGKSLSLGADRCESRSESAGKELRKYGSEFRASAHRRPIFPGLPSLAPSRMVRHPGVPPGRASELGIGPSDHRGRPCRALPVGTRRHRGSPLGPRDHPARIRPALPFALAARTLHTLEPRRPDRISELLRSRARSTARSSGTSARR